MKNLESIEILPIYDQPYNLGMPDHCKYDGSNFKFEEIKTKKNYKKTKIYYFKMFKNRYNPPLQKKNIYNPKFYLVKTNVNFT